MKPAQLQALEEAINEKIRAHVPVNVQLLSIDDPAVDKVHIILYEYLMVLKHSSSCSTARTKVKILDIATECLLLNVLHILTTANNCICTDITFVMCVPDADSRAARRLCWAHSDG